MPPTVELKVGGTWTDITGWTRASDRIKITRGRSEWASSLEPSSAVLSLNNRDGRFSPRNPLGPYYGLIGRNTPIRVSVTGPTNFLNIPGGPGNRATTPDVAALDIVGDIDVRVDLALESWDAGTVELCAKQDLSTNQRSWRLVRLPDGTVEFTWTTLGTSASGTSVASTVVPVIRTSQRLAVRVTLDVDNGAGGSTTTFYTATSLAGPWTQLGNQVVTAGVTSIFNSNAPLEVGDVAGLGLTPPIGRYYGLELRNGINGTIVASPVFTTQTVGATTFVDGAGRTWTLVGGAEITNRIVRFYGEVSSWPPRWDTTGTDVYVAIEAAGISRRLGQGASPLKSTLSRRIPAYHPLAYWPMEDGALATSAASPITGVAPLATTNLTYASVNTLPGSDPLPVIGTLVATLKGSVPAPPPGSTMWHTEFVYRMDVANTTLYTYMRYLSTGTVREWFIQIRNNLTRVFGLDIDGNTVFSQDITTSIDIFSQWVRVQFFASQSGSNVNWSITFIKVGGSGGAATGSFAGTVGQITGVASPADGYSVNLQGLALGHIGVFADNDSNIYNFADHGFNGETASARVARLAGEESVGVLVSGDQTAAQAMGPQKPQTLLALVSECADADAGLLYEARTQPWLAYRGRTTLYNQTPTLALDYAAFQLHGDLQPVDDDQSTKNDITVTRVDGSSARVTQDDGPLSTLPPPNGVGPYTDSVTVNVFSDDDVEPVAGWRLHMGTVDETRYPQITVHLASARFTASPTLTAAALDTDIGDRLTMANPPSWLPPDTITQVVQGYTETIDKFEHIITFNCSPESPYHVAITDDPVLGVADTDGSQLAAAATSTDTTISVATTAGPVWTTSHAETPWDIRVGGEVMTVPVVGSLMNGNPFMTTDATGWTTSSSTIARDTTVFPPQGVASMKVTPDGVSASGGIASTPRTAVGTITVGASYVAMGWVYSPAGWSDLRAVIDWYDASNVLLSTGLGVATAVPAGAWTFLTQTLVAPASASRAQVRMRHGATPASTAVWYAWGIRMVPATSVSATSPQTMSVIRSINGVVKAQASGTDVRLANPMIVAL